MSCTGADSIGDTTGTAVGAGRGVRSKESYKRTGEFEDVVVDVVSDGVSGELLSLLDLDVSCRWLDTQLQVWITSHKHPFIGFGADY